MISHNNANNANQQATTKIGAKTVTTRHYGELWGYPKRPSGARRPRLLPCKQRETDIQRHKIQGTRKPSLEHTRHHQPLNHPYSTAEPTRCTPSFAGAPPPISGTIATMSKHETRTPSNRYSDDGIKPNDYEHINDYNDDITWGGYFELHGDMAHILRFIELKCQSGIEWYNDNYYELSAAPTTTPNNVEEDTNRTTTNTEENITSALGREQPNTDNLTEEHGAADTGRDKGKGALRHFRMDAESMNTRFSEQPMIIECLCKDNDAGLSGVSKLMVSIREREVIHNRRDKHMMRHRDLFIPEVVLTDFYEEGDTRVITAQWTALNPCVGTVRDMMEEWMIHGDSSYFTSSYKQSPDGAVVMYDRCFITWADVENAAREVVSNSTNGVTWGMLKDDRFDDDSHIVLYNPYSPNGSALVFVNPTRRTDSSDAGICVGDGGTAGNGAAATLGGDTAAAGCTPTVYLVDGHDYPSGKLESKYGAYYRSKKPTESYRLPDNAVRLPNRPATYNQFYNMVSWWFNMDDTAARAAVTHTTTIAEKLDDGRTWTLLPSNA